MSLKYSWTIISKTLVKLLLHYSIALSLKDPSLNTCVLWYHKLKYDGSSEMRWLTNGTLISPKELMLFVLFTSWIGLGRFKNKDWDSWLLGQWKWVKESTLYCTTISLNAFELVFDSFFYLFLRFFHARKVFLVDLSCFPDAHLFASFLWSSLPF